MSRLKDKYKKEILKDLMKKFNYKNVMQVPKLEKVSVNIGVGEATKDRPVLDNARKELEAIAGQHAIITKAKKSISNFKLRAGNQLAQKLLFVVRKCMNLWIDFLVSLYHG